jgi:3-isopropylmalate/(R)-2-methylmalate dehydratase small subunit
MEKISVFEGVAAPLKRSNVDTDQIIPAVYLKRITKSGFEDGLFANWRGQESDFVLNQPVFQNAEILVTGPDFGTGSSREHAVWALRDFGFKAVFSPKFADIFRGNSGKQGFITGVITEDETKALWDLIDANPGVSATVDLPNQTLSLGEMTVSFEIDPYTKWRLMEGLDDIALTLRDEPAITSFESNRESWRPQTLPAKGI